MSEGLGASCQWGSAQFTVDFMLIGMSQELLEQDIGATQFENLVSSQERGQALLPVVVAAFDFAFGLVCGLHPRRTEQNGSSP